MDLPKHIVEPGTPDQLGAHSDGKGVNFAIFSSAATKIELCLFDEDGKNEIARIELPERTGDIWHGYVPDLKPGQVYGYRVHGPYDPAQGHRFNPNKLLLDPYAREVVGHYKRTEAHDDFNKDNAADTIKGRVVAPFDKKEAPINTSWAKTIIYEMHLKGFTIADPAVPADKRGTCEAMTEPAVIDYLKKLGITAVEFLPMNAKLYEDKLAKAGLKNYWGYYTAGFFSIEPEYLKTGKREEFRAMVEALHKAGIEVILDVVHNHTAEHDHLGPTISFRGIDNAAYYKLNPHDKSKYIDETGVGNTLNVAHPQVRRLIIENLRYWVEEFGIDGFRFDEAPVLGRPGTHFDRNAQLLQEIAADPVLSKVKLIAEPWDCSQDPYQLGNFPKDWHEWNGRFRDDIRQFWRGDAAMMSHKATRMAGSCPEFNNRGPLASINMVTCHDGFTMDDLVSYNHKHNEANTENNRDGIDHNLSCNYGVEGDTTDPALIALRERQKRNMLASLFLAEGVPMLLAGDEFGNSQKGNNNAYCQDNPVGWLNRDQLSEKDKDMTRFVQKLIALRKEHPVLQHDTFLHGSNHDAHGVSDLEWINASGHKNTEADWHNGENRCFGMMVNDGAVNGKGTGERLIAIFNAASNPVPFNLPALAGGDGWHRVLDTAEPDMKEDSKKLSGQYTVPARSVTVFVQTPKTPG